MNTSKTGIKKKETAIAKKNKKILDALQNITWSPEQYKEWKKDRKKLFSPKAL